MRLRLYIERNELPAVSVVWPVSKTQLKLTVAQLLELVNASHPLESEHWGLEHYHVSVGGYEVLHYHQLGAVFEKDDEVTIRPLLYAETRARTLLGRDQITADGRHLVDGVPFGRPCLKGAVRPEIWIPPRKRRRLLEDDGDLAEAEVGDGALVRFESEDDAELDDGDSEEDDEDFAEADEEDEEKSETSSDESSSEDEDDESEDDSSSATSEDSEDDMDVDENASETSWDGIESAPPTPPSKKAASQTELGSRMTLTNGHTAAAAKDALKRKAPAEEPHDQERQDSAKKAKVANLPFEGKKQTKERNARRRNSNKLNYLKKVGLLPPDANLHALQVWEEENERKPDEAEPAEEEADAELVDGDGEALPVTEEDTSETRYHLSTGQEAFDKFSRAAENAATTEAAAASTKSMKRKEMSEADEISVKRQKLLDAIASGGVDVTAAPTKKRKECAPSQTEESQDEAPEEMSAKQPAQPRASDAEVNGAASSSDDAAPTATKAKATDMVPASVARRSKLDLAGSQRLVFGSLGVRVPKTQAEKDALQKKLSDRAKQRMAPPTEASASTSTASTPVNKANPDEVSLDVAEQGEEADDESWREKIELSAVECCEEGVTLSTPPFPFYQRWDPQQQRKKAKGRTSKIYLKSKNKRHKLGDGVGEFVEMYDKYNVNGQDDALDYDDVADDDEGYWEEGALLDGEYDEEDGADKQLRGEAAQQLVDDGFPPLPADVSTLPMLTEEDASQGDFVVYKELACSAATGWQPAMLTRSAQLVTKDKGNWAIKLAMRDLRTKEYDAEGNRVYKKFEMEEMSDNEEDERVKAVQWNELVEPRLLLRGSQ